MYEEEAIGYEDEETVRGLYPLGIYSLPV